jgi:hypothetical protein
MKVEDLRESGEKRVCMCGEKSKIFFENPKIVKVSCASRVVATPAICCPVNTAVYCNF